jgi:hypothetical protein
MVKPEPLPVNVVSAWAGVGMNAQIAEVVVAAIAAELWGSFHEKIQNTILSSPLLSLCQVSIATSCRDRYNSLHGHDPDFDAAQEFPWPGRR